MTVLVCSAELLREGISQVLDGSEFQVIAAGSSIEAILPLVGAKRPKLAVLVAQKAKVRTWCREISTRFPGIRIVVLADGFACPHFDLMRDWGVAGLLNHTVSGDNLLKALQ